jgi:hypothetical protein
MAMWQRPTIVAIHDNNLFKPDKHAAYNSGLRKRQAEAFNKFWQKNIQIWHREILDLWLHFNEIGYNFELSSFLSREHWVVVKR